MNGTLYKHEYWQLANAYDNARLVDQDESTDPSEPPWWVDHTDFYMAYLQRRDTPWDREKFLSMLEDRAEVEAEFKARNEANAADKAKDAGTDRDKGFNKGLDKGSGGEGGGKNEDKGMEKGGGGSSSSSKGQNANMVHRDKDLKRKSAEGKAEGQVSKGRFTFQGFA